MIGYVEHYLCLVGMLRDEAQDSWKTVACDLIVADRAMEEIASVHRCSTKGICVM